MSEPASQKNLGSAGDWLKLQRKIFSRWIQLKLAKRPQVVVQDVVSDINSGILLINLMEVLSEKEYTAKYSKDPKLRVNKIDNVSNVLKFIFDVCKVEMKIKPSAEEIVDGNEKMILALIWALMLKYIKIGDDEDGPQMNPRDALLLWCQQQTADYKLPNELDKFGKGFHDGMALCAIIHRHRPKLIQWETLNPENRIQNIQTAMDAAYKYFFLEKYLTPEDFLHLDENSMMIYLSEYYYGIAEQTKLDLAARRIGKVIKLTKENDAMKEEFNKTGERFLSYLKKVENVLEDRTIDNNMAGAKKRIEDLYEYKTKDKIQIIGDQLNLEALYNTLAMKLSHNKRPEYVPPAGLSLKDIEASMAHLESCEQERKVALHAELNRQIKLHKLDEQHKDRFSKLKEWVANKEAYLKTKEVIDSTSGAQLQLRLLDAYEKENAAFQENVVSYLKKIGAELSTEKFERISDVQTREADIDASFATLASLAQAKRPVLEDDLAREQFKDKVRRMNEQHLDKFKKLQAWIHEKETFLNAREDIDSVSAARTQLSLLATYESDKKTMTETNVAQLQKLGADILAQKYQSTYSSYVFENPDEIKQREAAILDKWKALDDLAVEKKKVLDDHLAREEFKAKVRMMNRNHINKHDKLQSWIAEKEAYLNTKEQIASVSEAKTQLSLLDAYEQEKTTMTNNNVNQLKVLGAEILAQKYETSYSSWVFETPDEIKTREASIDQKWALLSQLSAEKKNVLDDDLAREIFKEKVRLMNSNHVDRSHKLQAWVSEKEAYLNTRETVNSVSEAQTQLSLLETYEKEKQTITENSLPPLKALGAEILAQKYETKYSSYVFENPQEIKEREDSVDQKWKLLGELSAEKKKVLDDHLSREEFIEKVRLMNSNHEDNYNKLQAWIADKEAYLNTREEILSVSAARTHLSLFATYEVDKKAKTESTVTQLKQLGADILAQKYQTSYSSYVFEKPEDIKQRESNVDEKWVLLDSLAVEKKKVLDDHLAREEFKAKVRMSNRNHIDKHDKLQSWIAEKEAYLNTKEQISSVSEAKTQLSLLDAYEKEKVSLTETTVSQLRQLGVEILAAKYQTNYSSWQFETPDDIRTREASIDQKWNLLSDLSAEKKRVLDDDLAREEFKEKVRLMNSNHVDRSNKLQNWIAEQEHYLQEKEKIDAVAEAQTHLALLDAYEKDKVAMAGSNVVQLKQLGKDILAQKYETKYSSYVFETPQEISQRESAIDEKWTVLSQLSAEKKKVLDDHLAREEFKEKVLLMNSNHLDKYEQLVSWTTEQETYLKAREELNSVSEAETALLLLDTYENEKASMTDSSVAKLKALGAEILAQKYETGYSSYVFEKPDEIHQRHSNVDSRWSLLSTLSAEKKKYLDEVLAREIEKERLRIEFAHQAAEFARWTKEQIQDATGAHFGFTLEEVQAYQAVLDKSDSEITAQADNRTKEYSQTWNSLQRMGVKENIYTTSTPDSLVVHGTELDGALKKRKSSYQVELDRLLANDALCKEFANAADPFSKWIVEVKDTITASKAELEEQLQFVEQKIATVDKDGAKIADLKTISDKMDAAGITNNKHTTLTLKDIELQWQQYQTFLTRKKQMLEEEIAHQKLRGISPEQFRDIENAFNRFDSNNSRTIDRRELKNCLYSLGEEKTKAEIQQILDKFGDGKEIKYEGFKEFMIEILGVSDTKEDILNGFQLINRGEEIAKVEHMDLVMAEEDLKYIVETASKEGSGYNYKAWVESVFAR